MSLKECQKQNIKKIKHSFSDYCNPDKYYRCEKGNRIARAPNPDIKMMLKTPKEKIKQYEQCVKDIMCSDCEVSPCKK